MSNRPTKQDAIDAWSAAATIDSMGDWLEQYTQEILKEGREKIQQDPAQGNPDAEEQPGQLDPLS